MALTLLACVPITWSIDTAGIASPGRASSAIRRALGEWSALTGLQFEWVAEGGQVSFVFRTITEPWAAYAQNGTVVIDPRVALWSGRLQQSVAAHEIGHILGIPHLQHDGSILSDVGFKGSHRVTVEDAALVKVQPCD